MTTEYVWIDSNGRKVNHEVIRKQPAADGTRYADGLTPEQLVELGYSEQAVTTRPNDYSDELYFRTEQDEAPYIVYERKPADMIERQNDAKGREAAQRFLNSTDYLFSADRHAQLLADEPEREAQLRADREAARQTIRAYKIKYPEELR